MFLSFFNQKQLGGATLLFDELILAIMKALNRERTVSAPYHLMKGKKSGQTLQDIGYYRLHPYFSVMPRLDKDIYNRSVQQLLQKGYLKPNDKVIDLTDKALTLPEPVTPLNGWKYRGREVLFLNRLSLVVQTFSHIGQGEKIFDPVVNNEEVQFWVKNYFRKINYRDTATLSSFKDEVQASLKETKLSENHKLILLQRLSGFGWSGLTWEQIAEELKLEVLDVQLQAIEMLHGWMELITSANYPLLFSLMEGVIQQSALTETAKRTEKLFQQGYSLEQIASLRHLKTSTIEDHFVELAMNEPGFDHRDFLDGESLKQIIATSDEQRTKRLRDIKEKLPEASYFQIRLALALKGEVR